MVDDDVSLEETVSDRLNLQIVINGDGKIKKTNKDVIVTLANPKLWEIETDQCEGNTEERLDRLPTEDHYGEDDWQQTPTFREQQKQI